MAYFQTDVSYLITYNPYRTYEAFESALSCTSGQYAFWLKKEIQKNKRNAVSL
jgi:hypothetical protein